MESMNIAKTTCGAVLFLLVSGTNSLFGADAAQPPAAASAATTTPTNGPAAGARGNNRGGPMTEAEKAEVAKLAELPALTPDAGDGDYAIGPMYANAPEQTAKDGVPKGRVVKFTLNSEDSKFYPGISKTNPGVVPYKRAVTVYIPSQYVAGTAAPFIVTHDSYGERGNQLPNILDNLIADHRLPVMIAIMVANGGGDAQGSERGLEYDTVSGKYAEYIEAEVLPKVEKDCGVTLTKDPDGRATMGGSSGGAVAFTMAWFHPELYHRVLTYSGTYVNQQSPFNPETPHGAWEYHDHLIAASAVKPLRIWLEVGETDNGYNATAAGFHNWVLANQRMAAVLKAKGYHYQFVYAKAAGHTAGKVIAQTMPEALLWLWKGYPVK
jgi:enterochelin esterase family protein